MILTTETMVTFLLPDEYLASVEFQKDHEDWKQHATTKCIGYSKKTTYSLDLSKYRKSLEEK